MEPLDPSSCAASVLLAASATCKEAGAPDWPASLAEAALEAGTAAADDDDDAPLAPQALYDAARAEATRAMRETAALFDEYTREMAALDAPPPWPICPRRALAVAPARAERPQPLPLR